MTEYWCQTDDLGKRTLRKELYVCPNGCEDGACNQPFAITILSPAKGKIYHAGDDLNIIWESNGLEKSDKINIWLTEYKDDSDIADYMVVVNLAGNLGAYDWEIPSGLDHDSDYRIKIEAYRNGTQLAKKKVPETSVLLNREVL